MSKEIVHEEDPEVLTPQEVENLLAEASANIDSAMMLLEKAADNYREVLRWSEIDDLSDR